MGKIAQSTPIPTEYPPWFEWVDLVHCVGLATIYASKSFARMRIKDLSQKKHAARIPSFSGIELKMAKAKQQHSTGDDIVIADGEELNLRNRNLAAFLGWVVPGAGHFYQRRYFKSAIFSSCVFCTFFIGMFVANYRCVYASWNGTEKRWQFVLQSGVGFIAIPAGIQAYTSRGDGKPMFGDRLIAPEDTQELDRWHHDTASGFDMGTLYTMIAGLLNVLVVFDAYAGPLPPPVPKKNEKEPSGKDEVEGDSPPQKKKDGKS